MSRVWPMGCHFPTADLKQFSNLLSLCIVFYFLTCPFSKTEASAVLCVIFYPPLKVQNDKWRINDSWRFLLAPVLYTGENHSLPTVFMRHRCRCQSLGPLCQISPDGKWVLCDIWTRDLLFSHGKRQDSILLASFIFSLDYGKIFYFKLCNEKCSGPEPRDLITILVVLWFLCLTLASAFIPWVRSVMF